MTNEFTPSAANHDEEETSLGKSTLYWLGIYAVVIPVTFVIVGFLVKTILGGAY